MRRMCRTLLVGAAGLALLAVTTTFHPVGGSSGHAPAADGARPVWTETEWPFAPDPWGRGKAYTCSAADCGTDIAVYVRAKIGLCDCTRGVADDEDLERVSDLDLIGSRTRASGAGRAIAVASREGRSRSYAITRSGRPGGTAAGTALAVAFHDRCDLVVATAVIGRDRVPDSEQTVLRLLNSQTVWLWLETTLGL